MRFTPQLALAIETLPARVRCTRQLALASETLQARVRCIPPLALASETLPARVRCIPPLALALETLPVRVRCTPLLNTDLHEKTLLNYVLGESHEEQTLQPRANWNGDDLLVQSAPQLRHCGIEDQLEADPAVPLLTHWRQHLQQRCWLPGDWRFFVVVAHTEILRVSRPGRGGRREGGREGGRDGGRGGGLRPELRRVLRLAPPLLHRGQDCCHRLLLVSPT